MASITQGAESTLNRVFEFFETADKGTAPAIGYSVQETADALNVNYYTARMYIADLLSAGKLERSDHKVGRVNFFRIPDAASTPKFSFNPKPGTKKISMLDAARTFQEPDSYPFYSELPNFPLVLGEFYSIAARIADGARLTNGEVTGLKANLTRLKLYSQNLTHVVNEMLSTPILWDVHSLAESLMLDPVAPLTSDEAREIATNIKAVWGKDGSDEDAP